MQTGQGPQDTRNYKAVFPGFQFCLTYPGLVAREAGNPELPKETDKKNPKLQEKPAPSSQMQQLP